MTASELIARARSQPIVTVERDVRVPGPELLSLLRGGKPMLVSEVDAHPDQHRERRTFRYAHVLGSGVEPVAAAQVSGHPTLRRLSPQILDFISQVDGVHLWADLETGRSYFGLLPVAEWQGVDEHPGAVLFDFLDELNPNSLVISYHQNGDYFLLLDPAVDRFIWFDPQSVSDSKVVALSIDELLAWWWETSEPLDPRLP